MKGKNEEVK